MIDTCRIFAEERGKPKNVLSKPIEVLVIGKLDLFFLRMVWAKVGITMGMLPQISVESDVKVQLPWKRHLLFLKEIFWRGMKIGELAVHPKLMDIKTKAQMNNKECLIDS